VFNLNQKHTTANLVESPVRINY